MELSQYARFNRLFGNHEQERRAQKTWELFKTRATLLLICSAIRLVS